jgi:hypothetical protein
LNTPFFIIDHLSPTHYSILKRGDRSSIQLSSTAVGEAAPCGPAARGVPLVSWDHGFVEDRKRGRGRAVRRCAPRISLNPSLHKRGLFLFQIPDSRSSDSTVTLFTRRHFFHFPNPSQLLFFRYDPFPIYDFRFPISDLRFHTS